MAGVTDHAFRILCRQFAPASSTVSEMVTARALVEGNSQDPDHAAARTTSRHPAASSSTAPAPGTMGEAVRRLIGDHGVQHVDLNFGCPVPKVTRRGGGAALPVRRRLFGDIVAPRCSAAAIDGVPLTVKFRIGIDDELLTYLDAGRIAEASGAAAVASTPAPPSSATLGRRPMGSHRRARRPRSPSIPVLGNGDVWEPGDALG